MKKMALLLCLSVAAGVVGLHAQSKSSVIERVLVRVNGEIFTQTQLTQRQTDVIREQNKLPPNATLSDEVLLRLVGQVTPDVLVDSVDELLLVQRGRELGAKYTDDQFKTSIDALKRDNKLDDEQFKKALAQEDLTLDELRANFEKAYLVRAVQGEEIYSKMTVTEPEMRQYYEGHKDSFMTEETITLREIFVSSPIQAQGGTDTVGSPTDVAAKARIDAIATRARGGESFDALAKELSETPSKANGGLVGTFNIAQVTPVVKDLVINLKPGEISQPLRGQRGGYQIFKLDARAVPELQAFEKVRSQIEEAIRADRLGGETEKLLQKLRAQAVIEWKDDSLRQVYEKRLVEKAEKTAAK